MIRFVLRRLALSIPLILGVMTLVFIALEVAPGDPADLLLGDPRMSTEVRERIVEAYGLDRSAPERYVRWMSAFLLDGELGWSSARSKPVAELLRTTLPPTLLLGAAALAAHLLVGIGLGIWSAARPGRWTDRVLTLGSLTVYAMPTFWLGMMAVLVGAELLGWFPAASMRSAAADTWSPVRRIGDLIWHLTLPAMVLGVASAASLVRFVRAGVLESLGQEFIKAARARGIPGRRVLVVHALRNAMLPVINLLGLSVPILVSGSLVTEVVFSWPGMGLLTYDAIQARDHAVILATTLLAALLVVLGNLAADVAMALVDPRVRLESGAKR